MLPEYINPYYFHPIGSRMADKSFLIVPSPKDYGQYLQNKRRRNFKGKKSKKVKRAFLLPKGRRRL